MRRRTTTIPALVVLQLLIAPFAHGLIEENEASSPPTSAPNSTWPSSTNNHDTSIPTTNRPTEFIHCVATPQRLDFCSTNLKWAPYMRLPNNLNHKSTLEFNETLTPATLLQVNELANVQCPTSDKLQLLICATLAPICMDNLLQPCRQLCIEAKSGCRQEMRRQSLEWPKFLDCRKFPRGPDRCIGRQPVIQPGSEVVASSSVSIQRDVVVAASANKTTRRRKEKKHKRISTTTTTTTTAAAPTIQLSTTTTPPVLLASTGSPVSGDQTINGSSSSAATASMAETTTSTTTTTTTTPFAVPTTALVTTTPELSNSNDSSSDTLPTRKSIVNPTVASYATAVTKVTATGQTTNPSSELVATVTTDPSLTDYSSMPISVTNDLTRLLCSNAPAWLIKTRLTDEQLVVAVKKRKLRVGNYRQLFGTLTNSSKSTSTGKRNPTTTANTNTTLPATRTRRSSSATLYLTLPDSTVFVTAMGPALYTQPLTDALSRAGESQTTTEMKSSGRNYLISGSGDVNSAVRSTYVFVVLPDTKTITSDTDPRGSLDIKKAYRNFKMHGAGACRRDRKQRHRTSSMEPSLVASVSDDGNLATELTGGSVIANLSHEQSATASVSRAKINRFRKQT